MYGVDIPCISPFRMLRNEGAKFVLPQPTAALTLSAMLGGVGMSGQGAADSIAGANATDPDA